MPGLSPGRHLRASRHRRQAARPHALERPALPTDQAERPQALNHVAVAYPNREAWLAQIAFLAARGVALHRQVDRGATCSIHLTDPDGNEIELVYEKPRALWEGDIQAALNTAVEQPIHG